MRDRILSEIRRLAAANGGKPVGHRAFEQASGIRHADWFGVYWAKWSDAVAEAGLAPNAMTSRLDRAFVLRKVAEAYQHYGHPAASGELRLYTRRDPTFPSDKTISRHFGSKPQLLHALRGWAEGEDGFADVVAMIPEAEPNATSAEPAVPRRGKVSDGGVYLLRSGDFYKIGRSDEVEKRIKQITVALPDKATLEHMITTDDPPGIEAYWHRRFADRRANGEWFKLTPADVLAFRRRRFQ